MRFESFSHMLEYYAERTPDTPALLYGNSAEKILTFSALKDAVNARAAELSAENEGTLGILCDGTADCVITIFGASSAGRRSVLLNENLPEEVLAELIAYTGVSSLSGDPDLVNDLAPYLCPKTAADDPAEMTAGPAESPQVLFFTSGTTERSKAVVLTERSLMASAWNGSCVLPLSPEDRLLCMLPLDHVFGFVCGLLWPLSCGAACALGRGARHYIDDCALYKPTVLTAVPTLWGFLVKYKAVNPDLKTVLIGAGDCPAPLIDAGRALGIRMCFGYGLTETSSGIALSCGEGDPYALTICPDDTVTLAPDGEILVRAPLTMMQGYYKKEDATAAALKDGVLHTGDLGSLDQDGKLRVTGRKKEMLVRPDGTKIFLPEYESECAAALGTNEVCILERDGKLTLAAVLPGEDTASVMKKLAGVLAKRPRGQQFARIEIRTEPLPRTASGKLRRWEV